jgi:ribonuclease D
MAHWQYDYLTTAQELLQFCEAIPPGAAIAFDTEFVSEDSYRPELCLAQVAVAGRLTVIDTLAVPDLTPFWERLATAGHTTIVHAGREEFLFCLHAIGRRPQDLFDTQIAAGLIGLEYPAAYNTLIAKLLGRTLGKGETRTDWRRRPLTRSQLEYAVQDVIHLEPLRRIMVEKLQRHGRLAWLEEELSNWQSQLEESELSQRWHRVPGLGSLAPQSLAIARHLWAWRDSEARRLNRPPRRILRDDLLTELAKRATADPPRIRALRGMERRDKQKYLPAIAACIREALALPPDQWPTPPERAPNRPQLALLSQFLAAALGSVCRSQQLAASLVATVQDVRDLIAYRLGLDPPADGQLPALARGWRAEVVGHTLEDLLAGRLAFYIEDPLAEQPLGFEPRRASCPTDA